MSFLDRFKIQPKHKSPDPEVRIASVQELTATDEDAAVLVALAREDTDARVRRAAAARLTRKSVSSVASATRTASSPSSAPSSGTDARRIAGSGDLCPGWILKRSRKDMGALLTRVIRKSPARDL